MLTAYKNNAKYVNISSMEKLIALKHNASGRSNCKFVNIHEILNVLKSH